MRSDSSDGLISRLGRMYWGERDKVLAGAYAGKPDLAGSRERLQGLYDLGVRTIINLMELDERNYDNQLFSPYDGIFRDIAEKGGEVVDCRRFEIRDNGIPSFALMDEIVEAIEKGLQGGGRVYVHCFGGIGRTGTVIACWLLRRGLATPANVFDELAKLRRTDRVRGDCASPEPGIQRDFVLSWAAKKGINRPSRGSGERPPASKQDWFTKLMGFTERNPKEVRAWVELEGEHLVSRVSGARYRFGRLEIPTLGELRTQCEGLPVRTGRLTIEEWVGNVKELHRDSRNENALIQAASQFNLLEMVGPNVTPEHGIGGYENDGTQGPACAISCGAGTVYRNYFVPVGGQIGQSAECQVDCLKDIGEALGNASKRLWEMRNGYALFEPRGLSKVALKLNSSSEEELEVLRTKLRIGIQWGTEVTLKGCGHSVSQVYGSALPIGYCNCKLSDWEPIARLVLDASYEATLAAAVLNFARTGSANVYLTTIGGGVFGNPHPWIFSAIQRACDRFRDIPLRVVMVSYGRSSDHVRDLITNFAKAS